MVKPINNIIIEAEKIRCSVSLQVIPSTENNEEINVWLKLYRSVLDKYRYTSLELAMRSAVLKAYSIANFPTANSVRLGSSEKNKEQCHSIVALSN
jgi:Na+-transporting NADH:ubiquinone oxidoreductase subunit NqrF